MFRMKIRQLHQSQILRSPLEEVWDFFSKPSNLNEITPPGLRLERLGGTETEIQTGQLLWYRLNLAPFIYRTWVTEIKQVLPYELFVDEQKFGPYRLWVHRHSFKSLGENHTQISDHVIYAMPFWPFGEVAHAIRVGSMLETIFHHRRAELAKRFGEDQSDL